MEMLKEMKGTPMKPNPEGPGTHIPIRIETGPKLEEEVEESKPLRKEGGSRRFRINDAVLEKYKYTKGCIGCEFKKKSSGLSPCHTGGRYREPSRSPHEVLRQS